MDCQNNFDPLKLVREGTNQDERISNALRPEYAPINEYTPAYEMVFAQQFSAFLKFYTSPDTATGTWHPFFSKDVSVQLAIASVQNVNEYRQKVKETFDFLNDISHDKPSFEAECKRKLGYLFSSIGTLSVRLDILLGLLPDTLPLKKNLQNAIHSQLSAYFRRFWAYYKNDLPPGSGLISNEPFPVSILGGPSLPVSKAHQYNYSSYWIDGNLTDWSAYLSSIAPLNEYGTSVSDSVFKKINRLTTHNLFTSIFDQFLKVYAWTVAEAKTALEGTFANWNDHAPHYALFLSFLRLMEYAREETNTLTRRHLNFYYRDVLRLREKPSQPGHVHLLVELAKQAEPYLIKNGELFKAGKDNLKKDVFFANDVDFVANQAKVSELKTVYRHKNTSAESLTGQQDRLFASPVANSDDGLGAKLTSADESWHPFYNKVYDDGALEEIRMPKAEIGFAISSHYLLMAEGTRTITVDFTLDNTFTDTSDFKDDIICFLTTEKEWLKKPASQFSLSGSGALQLVIELTGDDPSVTPYIVKTHGYNFSTALPVLLIKLLHKESNYRYRIFQDVIIQKIDLTVAVTGLKTLSISNDMGPIDASKPFQPFGPSPVQGSTLIIGSKEVFQKRLNSASVNLTWLTSPNPYKTTPGVSIYVLKEGQWTQSSGATSVNLNSTSFDLAQVLGLEIIDLPDLEAEQFYGTTSRHGFIKLGLTAGFGQADYQTDLLKYLRKDSGATDPGSPRIGPFVSTLSINYNATQTIDLTSAQEDVFKDRKAHFFHIGPFGQAEQHPWLKAQGSFLDVEQKVYLLPQFQFQRDGMKSESEAEFYIGLTELKPPQSVALLFQVADGTANPLASKPEPSHLHWSYMQNNEWIAFRKNEVSDETGELLNSGLVTLAIPESATATNTLLPWGIHWIRIAVSEKSDAVCRLVMVAAQALKATFSNHENDPAFSANALPAGTITKLDQPVAAVKKIAQPFPSFGGRGAEAPDAFYTRISERLRHKDRAIALWDYERLVLEAFPQIYKVKCLNYTHYEPADATGSGGIYNELAQGHTTIVTIPNQQYQKVRDPLRPFTSLGLLQEIDTFLRKRLSCFVQLHVKNPEFEEVKVTCNVRLYDGYDETFYIGKLKNSITRFLSPWAFPGGGSPSFGGKIYQSVLINFVEEQPYVDYVTGFQLTHIVGSIETTKTEIEGSKAVSILVSVPAEQHEVLPIKLAAEETSDEKCTCET